MFKTLPLGPLETIFKELNLKDFSACLRVEKFFLQSANTLELWKHLVSKKSNLHPKIIDWISECTVLSMLKIRLTIALKKISDFNKFTSGEKISCLEKSSLSQEELRVIIHTFPEEIMNFINKITLPEVNIYSSKLPDMTFFKLAKEDSTTALALLENKELHTFFSQKKFQRYICLLATKHTEIIQFILNDPITHKNFLSNEDFLRPLKKHKQFMNSLTSTIQSLMGQNYKSLQVNLEMQDQDSKSKINPKNPRIML